MCDIFNNINFINHTKITVSFFNNINKSIIANNFKQENMQQTMWENSLLTYLNATSYIITCWA